MLELDLRSREPIYEHLVEKIKELIINKVLKADEQLPTVRELAGQLTVNPNTVQKAYRELEYRGYIYSVPAKVILLNLPFPGDNAARLQILQSNLEQLVAEMLYLGMTPREINAILQSSLSADKGGSLND
jgi:GntR family transcriptional regulator